MTSIFLAEANKLKQAQLLLEKNEHCFNLLEKYGGEFNLAEFYLETEKQRVLEIEKLTNDLKQIVQGLRTKKRVLKVEDINSLDLKAFKKTMINLQEKIQLLKIKLKANEEVLKEQAKQALEEVEPFNQKISEWERPVKFFSSMHYKINSTISTESNHKEVQDFMDFVKQSNGHENGWSSDDHQLFIKYRNKYKNIDNLAVNLHKIMPDLSVEEIKNHEIWYTKYLHLKTKKKEALEKWRISKNNETKENRATNSQVTIPPIPVKTHNKPHKTPSIKLAKLAQWKAEKEFKTHQTRLLEQTRQEYLKKMYEEKQKAHEEVKKTVEQWKEAKLAKEEMEKIQKEIKEYKEKKMRATEANKLIKQFQSQDDIYVVRRRNCIRSEKEEAKPRSKSSTNYRDPERLFKPTKQWILRTCKDNLENSEAIPVPNIRIIPKLGVPEWRKQNNNSNN